MLPGCWPFYLKLQDIRLKRFTAEIKTGSALSKVTGSKFVSDIQKINNHSDIYFITTNDDSIAEVVTHLPDSQSIVVHTSGTVDIQVLKKKFKNAGVVYPLQSITSASVLSDELTFCLEATSNKVLTSLKQLITSVNCRFVVMNSQKEQNCILLLCW